MNHNYPHCWRCNTPLLYYSKPSLYIKTTEFKDKVIENNNKINWYPSYVGEKRFGNWLSNMNDWAISRNRYWGTPIPLWKCDCGHMEMIGSRNELIEKLNTSIPELKSKITIEGIDSLSDSSVDYLLTAKSSVKNEFVVKRKLLKEIKNAFDQNGIEIPYPQVEVHNEK